MAAMARNRLPYRLTRFLPPSLRRMQSGHRNEPRTGLKPPSAVSRADCLDWSPEDTKPPRSGARIVRIGFVLRIVWWYDAILSLCGHRSRADRMG